MSGLNYHKQNADQKITGNQNEENKSNDEQASLSRSILELSKIVIYDYWYDYTKPESMEIVQNFATRTLTDLSHIKFEHVLTDIAGDVKTRFDISNYEVYQIMNH